MLQKTTAIDEFERKLGAPRVWKSKTKREFRLWIQGSNGVEVIACGTALSESQLRQSLSDRKGRRAATVVALCSALSDAKVLVAGPLASTDVRDLDIRDVLGAIEQAPKMSRHRSAVFLETEFRRLSELETASHQSLRERPHPRRDASR